MIEALGLDAGTVNRKTIPAEAKFVGEHMATFSTAVLLA